MWCGLAVGTVVQLLVLEIGCIGSSIPTCAAFLCVFFCAIFGVRLVFSVRLGF